MVPDLVEIITTPFAPLDPYNEVEEASFKTDIEATCSWAMLLRFPLNGAPSTIIRDTSALIEPIPRILIVGFVPGIPPGLITLIPGILRMAWVIVVADCLLSDSDEITATDPTIVSFVCFP